MIRTLIILLILFYPDRCSSFHPGKDKIICGADRVKEYLPLLKDKKIAVVANQTSITGTQHLVDSLLKLNVDIIRVFSPEHGFRGNVEDGALIEKETDRKTGLPVVSLYGQSKEMLPEQIEDIDIIIFDIQDVGARFYTFISTMHSVMKACAEAGKKLIILDRPNPNGDYIDGPVLQQGFRSFIGIHPVPVVHGLTIAELARMINGEGWLGEGHCDLITVECMNYSHSMVYEPPVPPSPNLPNYKSIRLYPSLAFFEGTVVSVGRGTDFPFQVFGHPELPFGDFSFTPVSRPGFSLYPPQERKLCRGIDLRNFIPEKKIDLQWLIRSYHSLSDTVFFTSYFDKLAGTDQLRKDIEKGLSAEEIRGKWDEDLEKYRVMRKKYLLYPD